MPKFEVGQSYRGFTFTKVLPLEELQITLYELRHDVTKARVMHLDANDPENFFCFSFPTFPSDSAGAPHILEHTVLCGSKKFPIKDPFFSMSRRSLNTFMNAMTGSDFTCYPAASQIENDFYNLMEVYLDAVFFPELKEPSFLQEGHRLEFEEVDNADSPLLFKGVVFNEMKGNLSSPESRLWQEIMTALTPDLPYAFNSGGDPKEIPHLTHQQLKAFHMRYYHPTHCLFFFYGNLPLTKHLDFITKHVLEDAHKSPEIPPIGHQKRMNKPKQLTTFYPTQDKDSKDFVTLSWLTTDLQNQEDVLSLTVLDSILMETDASPLKMPLLKSGLCMQADGYLDLETSEIPYTLICRGCEPNSTEKIEALILRTLQEIANNGIDPKLVEAAVHQLEFSRLEITGDTGPFGLNLFFRSGLALQHGCPPENALAVYSQFQKLQLLVKNPDYLPSLIRKYLINNPHRVTLTFKPDIHLSEKEEQVEKAWLNKIHHTLTTEEKTQIIKQTHALKKYQDKIEKQSLECLPQIGLSDIPKEASDFPLHHEDQNGLTIFHHDCFTNHIVFANLIFDLPYIALEDLSYTQLLISLLPEIGLGNRNYQENLEFMNAYLGGFSASLNLYPQVHNPHLLKPCFSFRGKALSRNADKLFTLFRDACLAPRLEDPDRIKELILQIHTSLENRLSRSAMSYGIQLSVSTFTQSAFIGEYWSGLKYFQFIRELVKNLDQNLPKIIHKLKTLQNTLFHLTAPHLVVSCDTKQYRTLCKEGYYGVGSLPSSPFTPWKNHSILSTLPTQARSISSPVAFSAMGLPTAAMHSPHAPALSLSTDLLENTVLHKKIREQGGAYGSGASYNPMTGNYYFYGYRDPHIQATFQAFQDAIKAISKGQFTDKDLTEAKLGIIQDLDSPISPGSRAMVAYHYFREGRSKAFRQNYRDTLLNIQKKDMKNVVTEQLLDHLDKAVKVTFTSESHLKKDGADFPILPI